MIRFVAVLLLSVGTVLADSVELWNGKKAKNVEILKVEDGVLHYKRGDKVGEVALTKVKSLLKQGDGYTVDNVTDFTLKKSKGKVATVLIDEERDNFSQPLIRIFTCEKNSRGQLMVYLYQNTRHDDPTRSDGLPEVDAAAYKKIHCFVNRPDDLAYRVEVWQDGQLRTTHDEVMSKDLPSDWFRSLKLRSTRTFKVLTDTEMPAIDQVIEEKKEKPPGDFEIKMVSVKPEVLKVNPTAKVSYTLHTRKSKVRLPKVMFHYVTKDQEGQIEIGSLSLESKAGRTVEVTGGKVSRTADKKMDSSIRVTMREAQKEEKLKYLAFWRIEILWGEKVVASREKENASIKGSLPDEWWK